jgi:hypothetical protein
VGPALQCVNELMFALCTTFFLGLLLFLNWGPGRPAARYPLASVADASALCSCTVLGICPCPCPYFLLSRVHILLVYLDHSQVPITTSTETLVKEASRKYGKSALARGLILRTFQVIVLCAINGECAERPS